MPDKFTATWISHSSLSDYQRCPRSYYLKNVYKDPKTNRKIAVVSPPKSLGQAVHDVIESLSQYPKDTRFDRDLHEILEQRWQTVSEKRGGFKTPEEEKTYKERASAMIDRIKSNPGPLLDATIKLRQSLPYYWLSQEDNIILCGKIDWLIYHDEDDSVSVLDFKTGKTDEDSDSLQLPIYGLLVKNCQSKNINNYYYWYIDRDDNPTHVPSPDLEEAQKKILAQAKKISVARKLNHFQCPTAGGCRFCKEMEIVVSGKAEYVGTSSTNQDLYFIP